MKLLEITSEEIKFAVAEVTFTVTYELEYSHSEGEVHLDPQRNTYFEVFELEIDDEVLVDINDSESYQKFAPTQRIYNIIKNWVKNYHYHIEVI